MADLQEIMQMLNGVQVKTEKATNDLPKLKDTLSTFKQVERLALRYLALSRQMGLPDDIQKQIQTISRVIVMIRMAQISLGLMSGNPLSVMIGFAGVLGVGMSVKDMMQMG
jgi:hypothetical protein